MDKKLMRRRDFIKKTGLGIGSYFLLQRQNIAESEEIVPSKVSVITHSKAVNEKGEINPEIARGMVDRAITSLTGSSKAKEAWLKIFPSLKETEVIGLKVNTVNYQLPSHPEVAYAIADSLSEAGINSNNILIWDKSDKGLSRSKYAINDTKKGSRCFGYDHNKIGFDPDVKVEIPSVNLELYLSKLLTQYCDYMINVPVLKNISRAGVTLSLKNAYGYIPLSDLAYHPFKDLNVVDVVTKMHAHNNDPQIAELNAHPIIRKKTKVIICDALMGIYEHGPFGPPPVD